MLLVFFVTVVAIAKQATCQEESKIIKPICGKYEVPYKCPIVQPPIDVVATESIEKIRCRPCICIRGYEYDANGVCVPIKPVCGKYEEPNECAIILPALDAVPAESTEKIRCRPCRCIKGYQYDTNGVCVPIPVQCTKKNQVWDTCPPPCFSENCGDIKVVPETCNTLVAHVCVPQCVCVTDYRRNANRDCIPIRDCVTVSTS